MKNLSGAMLALVAVVASVFPAHAAEFGRLEGKYKCKVKLDLFGQVLPGKATMNVTVPKNEASATVKIADRFL